jgi:hypothetical protein
MGRRLLLLWLVLDPDIAANSILGFPFLKAIKASLLFESDSLLSGLFGETFPLEMIVPPKADTAPEVPESIPASFPATIREAANPSLSHT